MLSCGRVSHTKKLRWSIVKRADDRIFFVMSAYFKCIIVGKCLLFRQIAGRSVARRKKAVGGYGDRKVRVASRRV